MAHSQNRIIKTFDHIKEENQKALSLFITAGFPDESFSQEALEHLPEYGADIIELGIPFTDPMADGPAIQNSSLTALKNGMSVHKTIAMVAQFRKKNQYTPIILMGYFNPIYKYGCVQFAQDAAQAGVDGLIVVDLPPEEDEELRLPAQKAGLDFIKLITPTTTGGRLTKVLDHASGFLYYVSITGVTGTKTANTEQVRQHIDVIRQETTLPIAIGFGIKTPEDAKKMSAIGDAIVVGSAIIENIEKNRSLADLEKLVRSLKAALS